MPFRGQGDPDVHIRQVGHQNRSQTNPAFRDGGNVALASLRRQCRKYLPGLRRVQCARGIV